MDALLRSRRMLTSRRLPKSMSRICEAEGRAEIDSYKFDLPKARLVPGFGILLRRRTCLLLVKSHQPSLYSM